MTKKIILKIIIFILLALVVLTAWMILYPQRTGQHYVAFENKTFNVELATTDQERQQWLMYREFLDENDWMLFVFSDESIYKFWMKNTLIPLDMIRITEIDWENRVVDVQTAQPCKIESCELYTPNGKSKYVLEINAWLAEKYWINIWDLLYIE